MTDWSNPIKYDPDQPRDSAGRFGSGGGSLSVAENAAMQAFDGAEEHGEISADLRASYQGSMGNAIAGFPPESQAAIDRGLRRYSTPTMHLYESTDALTDAVASRLDGEVKGTCGGAFDSATGDLLLDGPMDKIGGDTLTPGTQENIYAHELGHVIDQDGSDKLGYRYSSSNEWAVAMVDEIDVDGDPLSPYARTSNAEGFAEYARLISTNPTLAQSGFPKSWDAWTKLGLINPEYDPWDKAASDTERLADIFNFGGFENDVFFDGIADSLDDGDKSIIKYDPDQPRDDNGRFGSGGGGSSGGGTATEDGGDPELKVEHPVSAAVAKVEENYPPKNPEGTTTYERHWAGGELTPERQELHDKMAEKMRSGVKPAAEGQKTYTMMGGGPASGKSSILKSGQVTLPEDQVKIDADGIKRQLPEYGAMIKDGDDRAAAYTHDESSDLGKRVQAESFADGQNVLLDGTGNASLESVEKKVNAARAAGYTVNAEYVTCSTDEAVRRNIQRANDPKSESYGRLPPEKMLRDTHRGVSQILPKAMEKGLFDSVRLWDTENMTGGKPTLVASGAGKDMTIHNQELWDKFLAKGSE